MTIIETIYNFLSSAFIILLLLIIFFGQNWQAWHASRQIKQAVKNLETWRNYGVKLLTEFIVPLSAETITEQDIKSFIFEMLEFFIIPPSNLDPPIYYKLNYLISRRESRYHQLILKFLPALSKDKLYQITALLMTTTEIDVLLKKVRHNLIIGEKTRSYLYILQTASEIGQILLKARTYRIALESLMLDLPIGDSIGPLSVKKLVMRIEPNFDFSSPHLEIMNDEIIKQKVNFEERECICLRTKGPESRVGNPGQAIQKILHQYDQTDQKIQLIISIDAYSKLEMERTGTVAQGLGVAIGSDSDTSLDKFQIENLALAHNPEIMLEAVVCRESVEDAVLPMSEEIEASIPKIIRHVKQIIRSQTEPGDHVIIVGIGNSIGVPLK